ncbi:hypothetical protein RHMOL_Rhmol01G0061300 [Rhododendron molle]|uniref:Uncharacterized protein n=1 Tax=Rhododendron molle TaxID=49168 RepID=A0ACC0Q013_RHOML|nr:hypothetical protein RHMOL_Rhmol01G0061300 [Rhododendron molle]
MFCSTTLFNSLNPSVHHICRVKKERKKKESFTTAMLKESIPVVLPNIVEYPAISRPLHTQNIMLVSVRIGFTVEIF